MAQSKIVDLIGLYAGDTQIPSELFVIRRDTDMSSFNGAIGRAISGRFVSGPHEGVPAYRPTCRIEGVGPDRLAALSTELGIIATDTEGIVEQIGMTHRLTVREVNEIGWE